MSVLIAIGELTPEDAPIPLDPYDRKLSKRQWELGMAGSKQTLSIVEGPCDIRFSWGEGGEIFTCNSNSSLFPSQVCRPGAAP